MNNTASSGRWAPRLPIRNPKSAIRNRLRPRAFTLLEVILVIGLIVVITSFAWPNLKGRITARQLPDSADNLRSALRIARASASYTGKRYRLHWDAGAQQPTVQYEVDPTLNGGKWDSATDSWTAQAILLGDVQLTKTLPGRPVYLTPVSHTASGLDDANTDDSSKLSALADAIGGGGLSAGGGDASSSSSAAADQPSDRPDIVFNVDGSSDWYTLIVSRTIPGQKLEDAAEQLWIVLDGRTGLPQIQQPLTKEQLADVTLRPDLDLLKPPEVALADLSLSDANPSLADASSSGQSQFGGPSGTGSQSQTGGQSGSTDGNGPMSGMTANADAAAASPAALAEMAAGKGGSTPMVSGPPPTADQIAAKLGGKSSAGSGSPRQPNPTMGQSPDKSGSRGGNSGGQNRADPGVNPRRPGGNVNGGQGTRNPGQRNPNPGQGNQNPGRNPQPGNGGQNGGNLPRVNVRTPRIGQNNVTRPGSNRSTSNNPLGGTGRNAGGNTQGNNAQQDQPIQSQPSGQ